LKAEHAQAQTKRGCKELQRHMKSQGLGEVLEGPEVCRDAALGGPTRNSHFGARSKGSAATVDEFS